MKLIPYLNFEGNCEEAIRLYQSIFGGSVSFENRYGNAPMDVPENYKNKILHCEFHFGDNALMACDAFPGQKIENAEGIILSVGYTSSAEAEAAFKQLAEGGKIIMPFEKQFWGDHLGQLTDKFGKRWMITSQN